MVVCAIGGEGEMSGAGVCGALGLMYVYLSKEHIIHHSDTVLFVTKLPEAEVLIIELYGQVHSVKVPLGHTETEAVLVKEYGEWKFYGEWLPDTRDASRQTFLAQYACRCTYCKKQNLAG